MRKNRCTLKFEVTASMKALKQGECIRVPLSWTSRQALYTAKRRLNDKCGWEQWSYAIERTGPKSGKYLIMRHKEAQG